MDREPCRDYGSKLFQFFLQGFRLVSKKTNNFVHAVASVSNNRPRAQCFIVRTSWLLINYIYVRFPNLVSKKKLFPGILGKNKLSNTLSFCLRLCSASSDRHDIRYQCHVAS